MVIIPTKREMDKKETSSIASNTDSVQPWSTVSPKVSSFFDSFRRAGPDSSQKSGNLENGEQPIELSLPLENNLKDRHIRMIAIAGCVGTGLFISLGTALSQAGPGGVLISYAVISVLLFFIVQSLGELSSAFPTQGNFLVYNSRFIDESWAFSMNFNYYLQWLVTFPLSLVSASLTIEYWGSNINPVVWVSIFYVFIVGLNLFGLKGYGEGEFIFSIIKIIAITGFCILSIVLICGGSPNNIGYIGGKYWHNPGAFATGFKGVCSVLVNAAFSFAGTELCALAASNAENPRTALPKAVRQVFWRILIFYMLSTLMVCFLVPSNAPDLLNGSSASAASPFIIAIKNSGIKALPSIFNVVILLSVLSVANASVFASTRPLVTMAEAGHAPKIFMYVDKKGRPLVALIFTFIFGLICFVSSSPKQADVFNWLLALSGLAAIFTWMSISIAHLRVLYACKVQNISKEDFPFLALGGFWSLAISYY